MDMRVHVRIATEPMQCRVLWGCRCCGGLCGMRGRHFLMDKQFIVIIIIITIRDNGQDLITGSGRQQTFALSRLSGHWHGSVFQDQFRGLTIIIIRSFLIKTHLLLSLDLHVTFRKVLCDLELIDESLGLQKSFDDI